MPFSPKYVTHAWFNALINYVTAASYPDQTARWRQAKTGEEQRVATILCTPFEGLCLSSVLLEPVVPERMAEIWRTLGWQPPQALHMALS